MMAGTMALPNLFSNIGNRYALFELTLENRLRLGKA